MTPPPQDPQAGRGLSVWGAGALVVASMIGTGVFTTSGLLLSELGQTWAVLVVWVVAGGLALAGAAVYAELGAMMPRVGGEYVYLSRGMHPLVGFLSGWIALWVGFVAPIAAGAAAFERYFEAAWPGAPGHAAGLGLIVAVTLLHARDVTWAARVQTVMTGVNLAAMVALIIAGVLVTPSPTPVATATTTLPTPSWGGFAVALVLVSYSYFGWNAASYVAGEVRDPARTLPRAVLWGCGLVTAIYVALNAVLLRAAPPAALAGRVEFAHVAAAALFGPRVARVLSAAICLVVAVSVSALAMTGPRIYLAMAEDGLFPRLFARRNSRGAPAAGMWVQGALAFALALTATFDALLTYVGFTLSLSSGATVAAALVLRVREPAASRPYRMPGGPVLPLAFCAASLWFTIDSVARRPRETLAGAVTILTGMIVYRAWASARRRG